MRTPSYLKELKTIRKKKKLTQHDLAKLLNMEASGYSKIERGESQLTVQKLEEILKIFNMTLQNFFSKNFISTNNTIRKMQLKMIELEEKISDYEVEIHYLNGKLKIYQKAKEEYDLFANQLLDEFSSL